MSRLDPFGRPTPTKLLSWALFVVGVVGAVGSRFVDRHSEWLGAGLLLIGLSMIVDVVLPGGSELNDDQVIMVKAIGFPRPERAHKLLSLILGVPLAAAGAHLLWG